MTMFRNVFGKHMAAQDGGNTTVPLVPMGGGAPQSSPGKKGEMRSYPEMASQPMPSQNPELDSEESIDEVVTPDLCARAADAHRKLVESQSAPKQTAKPQEPESKGPRSALAQPQETTEEVEANAPQTGRRSGGRTRTRLLGFDPGEDDVKDIFSVSDTSAPKVRSFPTGWMVVVAGPGRGHFFPLFGGVATIGRGDDQAIRLDFGDSAISRQNHAAVAYDSEDNKFYLGHGGKSNIIRLNGRPVLATEELNNGDTIRIGETTLRFVAFCLDNFSWVEK